MSGVFSYIRSAEKRWIFITVLMLELLAGAEADLFIPSFPTLQTLFGVNDFWTQMLLSGNLVLYCIFSFLFGILSDHYGSRRSIIGGMIIFLIGTSFCVVSSDFNTLLMGRLLQGAGIAGPAAIAYVVVVDLFSKKAQQSILAITNSLVTLGMSGAPLVGTMIIALYGWRASFWTLFGFGLVCLGLCVWILPASSAKRKKGPTAPQAHGTDVGYGSLMKPKILFFLIVGLGGCLPFWVFAGLSPLLYMSDLGVSLEHFGWYQGMIILSYSVFSFASPWIIQRFGAQRSYRISLMIFGVATVGVSLCAFWNLPNPFWLTVCMSVYAVGACIPVTVYYPQYLALAPTATGRMSALFTASRLIGAAFLMQFITYFSDSGFRFMGAVLVCVLWLGLVGFFLLSKWDWICWKSADGQGEP